MKLFIFVLILFFILLYFFIEYVKENNTNINRNFYILSNEKIKKEKKKYKDRIFENYYNFNPSISEYKDEYYVIYRFSNSHYKPSFINRRLGKKYSYNILEKIKITNNDKIIVLDRKAVNPKIKDKNLKYNGYEDPRLFVFNDELWVIANMHISEKENTICTYNVKNPEETLKLYNKRKFPFLNNLEKSWSPFQKDDKLLIEYFINPRILLEMNPYSGDLKHFINLGSINKDLQIRGGSVPIKTNINNKNYFIAIGHPPSFIKKEPYRLFNYLAFNRPLTNYKNIIYLFNYEYPHDIKAYTKEFNFYNKVYIEFSSGMVEKDGNYIISFGFNDYESKFVKMDKMWLSNNLIWV